MSKTEVLEDCLVKQLRYAGGNDEGLGGYVEALIITVNDSNKYVLHRYGEEIEGGNDSIYEISGEEEAKVIGKHEKIEFDTEKELLDNFPYGGRKKWKLTDRVCGYQIPKKKFQEAHEKRLRGG